MDEIGRKHPVHQPVYERHNLPVIIFLTICTKDRKTILANDALHQTILRAWQIADQWSVGRYVIMPNHVHLFCAPNEIPPQSLVRWVNFWKSTVARSWPNRDEVPIWQRHFWDTQLRQSESYYLKWDYVCENPVRAGLATRSDEWPYQGELNVLRW
jgi:putative transposase